MKNSLKSNSVDCLGLGIMPLDLLFVVDKFPSPGSKINGKSLTIQGGGPVPNVMVGLKRLGHSTSLITAVADDYPGQLGLEEINNDKVDTRFVVTKKGTSDTAAGFVESGSGQRTLVLNRTINVKPADLKLSQYPIPKIVHLDGRDIKASIKLARWAKSVGAIVTFDIGSMRNDVSPVFEYVDHLIVADVYAFGFTKTKSARAAIKKLANYCPGTIVVTEGIKGSTGFENSFFTKQAAFKVNNVDATGAGDAFHTGYIYGLLHKFDMRSRLEFGSAVAALKCTKMGARAGIPKLAAVNKFLRSAPPTYA